jgi:hypothetical protein
MTIDDLVAHQEIRDVLIRYTRGIDRRDRELVRSCYHPDAHDDHGPFKGSVDDFLDWLEAMHAYFASTMHFIGNQLVEVRGDVADAESYCVAYHRRAAVGREPAYDLVIGLRYVDRLERRDGEWRIADRLCVFDWTRRDDVTAEWEMGPEVVRGVAGPTDPVLRRS